MAAVGKHLFEQQDLLPRDSDRTRRNGFKLKGEIEVRCLEEICYSEGSEARAQLPREAVGAPSLEALRARLDGALGSLVLASGSHAHGRGLELMTFITPSKAILRFYYKEIKKICEKCRKELFHTKVGLVGTNYILFFVFLTIVVHSYKHSV